MARARPRPSRSWRATAEPDGGSVRVLDLDPKRDGRALKPRIGLMLQQGGLFPQITPREALELFASFYPDPEEPDKLMDALELGEVGDDPVSPVVGRPEAAPEPGPGARRSAGPGVPGRADGGDGPAGPTQHLAIDSLAARARHDRAADDALHGRSRATGESRRDHRSRSTGRPGYARPACATRSPTNCASPPSRRSPSSTSRSRSACRQPRSSAKTTAHSCWASSHRPRRVARLAAWLASQGALLTELRAGSRTLEQAFLALTENHQPQRDEPPQP